ncbi:MAG: bifunctional phosphoglucose/phosphomannose isomerase [Dehalococcoidia bacterium]|nr:MAG: bifunctional phosphoglucose/phosphomannose isomerase [Dehalococcoidia bacterium]
MINLDNLNVYKKYDPQNMLAHIHNVPELCHQAWQMATTFYLPPDYSGIDKVVVLGMGGSAIGGDLAASLVTGEADMPILVQRDYTLPSFVDDNTLIIASSYSGMTEETLSAFGQALNTDAKKLVITTGGRLEELAQEKGIPIFSFDYKAQPRAVLPFSFIPILNFLQRLGFINDKSADLDEMSVVLKQLANNIDESSPLSRNKAKQLAYSLFGKLTVIYGSCITNEVARRWKTQINENSKAWAFYETFPELNHNTVVGYSYPPELAPNIFVVMLKTRYLSQQILKRYQITIQILEKSNINSCVIEGLGESRLAQIMSLVLFGDYISYFLAILNRVNPTPVEAIDFLKSQLGNK